MVAADVADEGLLEMVDEFPAHQSGHEPRKEPVGHKGKEVVSRDDGVGGLVHGGVRLVLDVVHVFGFVAGQGAGEDEAGVLLMKGEEGRDEQPMLVKG